MALYHFLLVLSTWGLDRMIDCCSACRNCCSNQNPPCLMTWCSLSHHSCIRWKAQVDWGCSCPHSPSMTQIMAFCWLATSWLRLHLSSLPIHDTNNGFLLACYSPDFNVIELKYFSVSQVPGEWASMPVRYYLTNTLCYRTQMLGLERLPPRLQSCV